MRSARTISESWGIRENKKYKWIYEYHSDCRFPKLQRQYAHANGFYTLFFKKLFFVGQVYVVIYVLHVVQGFESFQHIFKGLYLVLGQGDFILRNHGNRGFEEYDSVLSWMYLNDLEGFAQDEAAADKGFIPDF